jgi:taurine dioxygenase
MLSVRPLAPLLGAAVSGLDLSRGISKPTAAELLRLLDAHGVLIVHGQQLTPHSLVAFGRSLGPLQTHARERCAVPEFPELLIYSNIVENGEPIGYPDAVRSWHMDGAHLKTPYRATLQYAAEIAIKVGVTPSDTRFASTRAAYDTLEPALRQQLFGMHAVHVHGITKTKRSTPYFADAGMSQIFRRGVDHPVVRTHPRSGHKSLYADPASTSHIRGMHARDSAALLAQLYAHIEQPAHVYRHCWQAGDLVLWDNGFIQHRTTADPEPPLRRLLYRALIREASES